MTDTRDLYQEVILDHYKRPRNRVRPEKTNRKAEGFNPLCGDKVTVYLDVEKGIVKEVGFEGSGCAISTASASMMTESLRGKSLEEAEKIITGFHALVTGEQPPPSPPPLGKLTVFTGVREFPARVKCASLAWHTARAAMSHTKTPITTE